MKKLTTLLLLLSLSLPLLAVPPTIREPSLSISSDLQKSLLETAPHKLKNQPIINNFYFQHHYQPLWFTTHGFKQEKIRTFLRYVHDDVTLNYRGYIYQESQRLIDMLNRRVSKKEALQLELRLTALYYEFLQHTIYGEIDWASFNATLRGLESQNIQANWEQYAPQFDVIELMSHENIMQTIYTMTPKHYRYQSLVTALRRLHQIKAQGAWKPLPYFKRLRLGDRNYLVSQLRERLRISGDYQECQANPLAQNPLFDGCLKVAVERFQSRHDLTVDGIVGAGTRAMLNQPIEKKIAQVLLNIDRIKWLKPENSERYIVVNLPEFLLHYVENQQESKTFKVIVGDRMHPTPIFSNSISYIVLNPYWKVPEGIVKREIVPHMIEDPNYITNQGLQAHMTWAEESAIVPLDQINWSDYLQEGNNFPYRLMQPPGPRNALGKIKFKFPNRFSVYLHDTPTKHLFNRKIRAFSHGCIRLSNPHSLLESIAMVDENIDLFEADNILMGKAKKQLNVAHKIPIHLIYLTAGVNANNQLIFRKDIYNYDNYQKRFIR